MKRALFVLFYSLMSVMLYGQGLAISADKMNVAYVGVDNPMTIVAEGYRCDQLEVTCENGTILKTGNCQYNFKPMKVGEQNVRVKVKKSNVFLDVGHVIYRAKLVPDPVVSLGRTGFPGRLYLGPAVRLMGFDFEVKFVVRDFMVEIKKKNGTVESLFNNGPLYSIQVREAIARINVGEKMTITNLYVVGPDNITRRLNDVSYTFQ